jgi:hypothetical protein
MQHIMPDRVRLGICRGDADRGRVLCSRVRGPDAGRGGGVQVAGSAEQWFMVFEVFSFDGRERVLFIGTQFSVLYTCCSS